MIGRKVLVFAPHPDDETIGCGGTIAKIIKDGGNVVIVWMTSGELGTKDHHRNGELAKVREREAKKAATTLGIKSYYFLRQPDSFLLATPQLIKQVAEIITTHKPETILCSYWDKINNDHIVTYDIVTRATLLAGGISKSLLCYEVWTPIEDCNYYEDTSDFLDTKLTALSAYKSQVKIIPYDQAIEGLNRYRGLMGIGKKYAEAFKIIYSK
ncbi:hypothetical protein C4577_06205 [Candidatus Parcubacteria bacterium]|nr:MAG: hypothetical protein C4577_06205 [Candidatus Parcubacteria bacterium]